MITTSSRWTTASRVIRASVVLHMLKLISPVFVTATSKLSFLENQKLIARTYEEIRGGVAPRTTESRRANIASATDCPIPPTGTLWNAVRSKRSSSGQIGAL